MIFSTLVLSNRPWSFSLTPRVGQEVESIFCILILAQITFVTRRYMLIKIRWHRNYTYWNFKYLQWKHCLNLSSLKRLETRRWRRDDVLLCVRICCFSASSVQWLLHHNVCGWFLQVTLNNKSLATCTNNKRYSLKILPQIEKFVNKIQLEFRLKFLVELNLFLICPQINIADSVLHITPGINMLWPDDCVIG